MADLDVHLPRYGIRMYQMFCFFLLIPILVLSLKRCNGWKDNHQRLTGVQTCCKKKHQPEVFDDLLGSPRQYMIIFFIVLNHPKKMLWLSWFRMAQASIFSAVPCTVFMCHLCETIICWTTECSSPGHEKTTKPSKIRLASEYVKKTWYKACSTTVCQVCDTSDRKQGSGFSHNASGSSG